VRPALAEKQGRERIEAAIIAERETGATSSLPAVFATADWPIRLDEELDPAA
jgi:hypothetical protein